LISRQDQPGLIYRLLQTTNSGYVVTFDNQYSVFTAKIVTLRSCLYQ